MDKVRAVALLGLFALFLYQEQALMYRKFGLDQRD